MSKLEAEILKVRNSAPITRVHIAGLLKFIGKPGTKRKQKIEAVSQLGLSNPQGEKVEDQLESYREF